MRKARKLRRQGRQRRTEQERARGTLSRDEGDDDHQQQAVLGDDGQASALTRACRNTQHEGYAKG
eukprot:3889314-Alexandrium_andersonii.AAC.1